MKTVAFTGYRPEKMPFVESKKDEQYLYFREQQLKIINRLIELGYTNFISGVAMGFDTWVAEDVLEIRKKNKSVQLECAIPFPEQDKKWALTDKIRRQKIIKHANESTVVSEHYSSDCFFARNRYMVDKADVIVCAYDGQTGGTAYTVMYAKGYFFVFSRSIFGFRGFKSLCRFDGLILKKVFFTVSWVRILSGRGRIYSVHH